MAGFLKVARTGDVLAGQGKMVEVGSKNVALFNVKGNYYAIDDTCTHQGGPLSDGDVAGSVVGPPAHEGVSRYKIRVVGNGIEIEI